MKNKIKYAAAIAACVLVSSCDEAKENSSPAAITTNSTSQSSDTAHQYHTAEEKPTAEIKPIERGPGPLTKGNTSMGGIHIGDSPEKVKSILGEPTTIGAVHSTPEVEWYYEKENLRVRFYRTSETEPIRGVEWIVLDGPSTKKLNDAIEIGDPVEKIQQSFEKVETYKDNENQLVKNYWVTGSTYTEGVYHPYLLFMVDETGKITKIDLSNHLIDPAQTK
ncbi:hypothetical protein [Paenibacillus sp. KR2-11]|uniref:hypothetical protein n=1 Tax=Paenibacillus sp. KR2-11 TaxID=3385500 RepID=UPI0038FC992A